jgi:hypothetical protein
MEYSASFFVLVVGTTNMLRKIWVTHTWDKTVLTADNWQFNPDIPVPAELDSVESCDSPLFRYCPEIWSLQIGEDITYKRRHPWLKLGIGWHETREEAEEYLEWERYRLPGIPSPSFARLHPHWTPLPHKPLDPNWLETARKQEQEIGTLIFREEQAKALAFALEHAKIPAPKTLPPGWGPIKV